MNIDNIYCMDCLEGMRQMESGSVSLIIADPPYELQQHNGTGAFGRKNREYHQGIYHLQSGVSNEILEECLRVCKHPNMYVFCSKDQLPQLLTFALSHGLKYDLAAANFIRQLTGTARDAQHDEAKARERLLAVVAELRTALEADGLKPADGSPELELLAVEFSTLRRIAALLMADGHTDIVVTATFEPPLRKGAAYAGVAASLHDTFSS